MKMEVKNWITEAVVVRTKTGKDTHWALSARSAGTVCGRRGGWVIKGATEATCERCSKTYAKSSQG